MLFRSVALLSFLVASEAFTAVPNGRTTVTRSAPLNALTVDLTKEQIRKDLIKELNYKPGQGPGEIAKRYGDMAGKEVKTVGDAFADFTKYLGHTVNALYKNMVTDVVGTTHLIVVNARFQRDPIWCAGILKSLDLVLKNYPQPEVRDEIYVALFKSMDMTYDDVKAEAKKVHDWAKGKSEAEVAAALAGEGDSFVAALAKQIKGDDLWMYSRYFGIGLLAIMEDVGVEQDKELSYNKVEELMGKMGKPSVTPCSDSDLFFKIKDKLDMMETMMKEIEIREKKRMADRLEEKADAALKAAEAAAAPAEAEEAPKSEEQVTA